MKQLTKAEEQVMQIMWELNEGVIKNVVDRFKEPRPAYTTVATVLKVLEKKGFVRSRKVGNVNLFTPLVDKKEYTSLLFNALLKNYFNSSFLKMATFYAIENNLSLDELQEILKNTETELKKMQEEKPWKRY